MVSINELKKVRMQKLESLQKSGLLAYPATTKRTHLIVEALKEFSKLSKSKKEIVLVGRIMALRGHGEATFLDIYDGSEKIQGLIKEDKLGEKGYKFFVGHFDIGDFVEIRGVLFKTRTGEKTIETQDYKMLAKSLLPLPGKWHGLQDEEEKLRKRYLDILFNPEVKEMIKKRAIFWNSMREFLMEKGFLEVETPVLEITTGGADAKPFITHHNALDLDLYLRISIGELWQKRLMVAGFEKTFEIGRQFRNEGMDAEHLQDYTQMEFYWAYADYKMGMKLVEELYKYIIKKTFGTLKFKIKDFNIDFGKKWEIYDYQTIINKYAKIDIFEASLPEMEKQLQKLEIIYDKNGFNKTRAIDNLWKYCRKNLSGPGFLINLPVDVSPLAKRDAKNNKIAQRFQVIVAGSEVGNGYSELNDPLDQEERFKEQQKLRELGDQEAQMFDHDFVEALEYGMPPTCGFGIGGERLFAFLMNKTVRECQIFPLIRPISLAGAEFNATTTPLASSIGSKKDYTIWQNSIIVTMREVIMKKIRFKKTGTLSNTDLQNFKLNIDGMMIGSVVASLDMDDYITFDLSPFPAILQTGTRVIKVVADVIGGSNLNFTMHLWDVDDIKLFDTKYKTESVLPDLVSNAPFTRRSTGEQTVN